MSAQAKFTKGTWLAIGIGVVVVATLAAAIATMGSPAQQRRVRLDGQRVDDLETWQRRVESYAIVHHALPPDLHATLEKGARFAPTSPETGAPYEYVRTGKRTYQLCATFDTDTRQSRPGDLDYTRDTNEWPHDAGRHCFDRESDFKDSAARASALLE